MLEKGQDPEQFGGFGGMGGYPNFNQQDAAKMFQEMVSLNVWFGNAK
jgi:hypothetical protein